MKILFPVVDGELNKEVLASGFHETKDVCVFDSETAEIEYMNVDDLGSSMRSLPKALSELQIDSIITTQIRPLALQILERCGLKVYKAKGTNVTQNLDIFQEEALNLYSVELSRELLACGGSCSSCSSSTCN